MYSKTGNAIEGKKPIACTSYSFRITLVCYNNLNWTQQSQIIAAKRWVTVLSLPKDCVGGRCFLLQPSYLEGSSDPEYS